jgi:hypothetical protein
MQVVVEDKLKQRDLLDQVQEEMVVVEQEQLQETVLVLQEQLTQVEVEVEKVHRLHYLEVHLADRV